MTISEQLNAGQAVVINGTMGAVTVRYESSKSRNGKPSRYVAGMIFSGNTLNNLYQQLAAREVVRAAREDIRAVRESYLAEMEPVVVSELDRAIMTGCVAAL